MTMKKEPNKTQTELTVITKGPNGIVENVIPFCIPEGETFEGVSYASTMLATPSEILESMQNEINELRKHDASRTRHIVRRFGYSAICCALVAIGLGSYLVHAENIDMVKVDAIYNRISAVEASPYNVGDIVCFKLVDNEAVRNKSRVLSGLKIDTNDWPGLTGDFIIARGEILEHHQTKTGDWFAKIAIGGVFARTDKTKFLEAKKAVIVSVREVRLTKALKHNQLNKID